VIGTTIGHYHVLDKLGEGGMGEVYRARDTRLERAVAVKVLSAAPLTSGDATRALRKEALALSRINHPNISAVYDFDIVDEVAFVVMELVEGADLRARIAAGGLPEKDVILLGLQAADALRAAHTAGIVHRDLKPSNLRVTPDGRLKALDFGLAAHVAPAGEASRLPTETVATRIAGTLPYMAPEQLHGEPPDPRVDIHALCAVLYEMATGVRPFDASTDAGVIDQILNEAPVSPRSRNPRVSAGLETILLKGLEKDPNRRYQSARELNVDLERLRAPSAGRAREPRRAPALRLPGRFVGRATVAGLVVATAVAAGVAWFYGTRGPALAFSPRDWILVTDLDNQTGEPVFDASLSTAFVVGLAQSAHANILPRPRMDEALRRMGRTDRPSIDEALGRELAQRERVRGVVVPGIGRLGQRYVLSARLVDPVTGTTVRSYLEHADHADGVLDALGRIGDAIRRDLGESLASIREVSRPLPQVTTASLEALRNHADGLALWRRGQYKEAVVHQQRAVELDPDFAMAHAALGNAYLSFIYNETDLGKQHLDRALSLADRTTERERMYLQATYEARLGNRQRAIDLYKAYLFRYPDDAAVRYNFGNLLRDLQRLDDAAAEYREVIRLAPGDANAHINLATADAQAGRVDQSLASYERAFALEPTWKTGGNLNHEYGFTLVSAGRVEEARAVFGLTLEAPEERPRGLRSLALLDLYEGRYTTAEPRLTESVRLNGALGRTLSEGRDWLYLSILREGLGDRRGQIECLDHATSLFQRTSAFAFLVRAGVAYARAGALSKAERVHVVVKKLPINNDGAFLSDLARLEGEISLARGQVAASLERLEWADAQQGALTEQTKEALAHAHERAGNADAAIAAYEALLKRMAIGWEPQQAWLAAHYRLATLYAKHGHPDRARAALDRLLTLWRNAEPGIPLLVAARRLRADLG
jgi:tetratricopeptide (TPR) repeat protein